MSNPWEDFGGTTTTDEAPWEEFSPTQTEAVKPDPTKERTRNAVRQSFGTFAAGEFGVTPEITPEIAQENPQILTDPVVSIPKIPIRKDEGGVSAFTKQMGNAVLSAGDFMLSPVGVLAPAAGAIAPVPTAAYFTADMLNNLRKMVPEYADKWDQMTPAEKGKAIADVTATGTFALVAGKGAARPVIDRINPKGAAIRELSKTLKEEPQVSEQPPTPTPQVSRFIKVPEGPFANPGVMELAGAALDEAGRIVKVPGKETAALDALRRELEPPQIVPEETRLAERVEGGGEAPYGKVSFMREAEAPLPERTQQATAAEKQILQDFLDREAEAGIQYPTEGLPKGVSYRKPSPAPTQEEFTRRAQRENVEKGLYDESGQYLDEPTNASLPEPTLAPEGPLNATTIVGISGRPKPLVKPTVLSALQRDRLRKAMERGASEEVILNIVRMSDKDLAQRNPPKPTVEQPAATTQAPEATKGIVTGRAIEKWADDVLKGGAMHAGPDVVAAYLVKGVALIERGVINFAEWSAKMIAEHGDSIKPQLRSLYDTAVQTASRSEPTEGTLKSARDIVESRLKAQQAPAAPAPTAQPTAPATGQPSAGLEDVYKIFEPAPVEKKSLSQRVTGATEAFRTGFSSKFRPVNKWVEDIAKEYGISKTDRKDWAGILEQLKGSTGKGEAEVMRFNRDVASLVKGNEKDFNAYMFLRRSLDRLSQDAKDSETRRRVGNYTIPELQSKLSTLESKLGSKLPAFQRAADMYQQYMDRALQLQVESGRMSPEVYGAIKSGNAFYAPFKVMKYLEESALPEGTGTKVDTVAAFTKAMEGITDPNFKLGDMLGAGRGSILLSRILADKATAMRVVTEQAAIDTKHLFVSKLMPDQKAPHGWGTVNVFEGGKPVKYAVRPEVAEALQMFPGTSTGVISRVLRKTSVPFKAGATALNIPFQVSNLLADVPRQALVSRYGLRGVTDLVRYPLDLVESMYASMVGDITGKPTKLFLDFMDSGAAGTTIQEHLTPNALKFREPTTMSKAKRAALNILYAPAEFAAAIEQTSKILGVKRAMRVHGVKSGAELAKKIPEAITEIRRFSGSPDFGRMGSWTEQARLNLLFMFLNARIQGTVADLGRLTGRDGAKTAAATWLKVGTAIGLPSAYLYALNNSPKYAKDYASRPQNEKDNYWLIPKSTYITNENGEIMRDYWRIPKRESSKWIANMVESGLQFSKEKNLDSFKNFSQRMLEDISPVNIQGNTFQERVESVGASLHPFIKGPVETATGRDMYRHRELVPDSMKKASPELQYTDRTAEVFKKVANAMPDVAPEVLRSPIMIENMVRNMTAGMLTQFLKRKPVEGRNAIENMALLQRFQAVPYTDNQKFVEQMRQLDREAADDYLNRHRQATHILDENKSGDIYVALGKAATDPKLLKHTLDLWVAKQNGITPQERQLLALPAKQRASYVMDLLKPMPPEQKEQAIIDLAKKRILTESVLSEIGSMGNP